MWIYQCYKQQILKTFTHCYNDHYDATLICLGLRILTVSSNIHWYFQWEASNNLLYLILQWRSDTSVGGGKAISDRLQISSIV